MLVVIALGGNALLRRGQPADYALQRANVATAVDAVVALAREHDVVVTHGNGPQVGLLALQGEAYADVEPYPLDVLGAESDGMIGYLLDQELINRLGGTVQVATLLTQIIVDPQDRAFARPEKFIGPVYDDATAHRLASERGWTVASDGRFWRRVVPSPEPRGIVELGTIKLLTDAGVLVVCVGGGGIPVAVDGDGRLRGVEAVVDKDRSAALLAEGLGADVLMMLTDVPAVEADHGTPNARAVGDITADELRGMSFAPGSMGPKVDAGCRFAERTGGLAVIGALSDATEILNGARGTRIRARLGDGMTAALSHETLPGALLHPGAFPHAPESVELRETHISWVFLAGPNAYKVKKPVRFPFLDYGTLERRRECCWAELELDRRFARSVYHGVVALVPDKRGGLRVAPEYDPDAVEFAVVMRRYDEATTLAARLARGTAGELDLLSVGAAVAAFHAEAPVEDHDSLPGVIEETLTTLATCGAPSRQLAGLARFCRAALAGFGPELARRARAGLVRDGHGDLRAEHILLGERVEAVDGVEFDRGLRVADVGYDLAFLVMDVARRDDELARTLVRGYRAGGGDPGSNGLFAFFCAVRALVRAKVDLLRAAQLEGAGSQERAGRAHELLQLAERFAWRARLPHVVCVTGLPASGKSTVAEALAAAAGRPLLSSDRIRKLRAGVDPYAYAGADAYSDAMSLAVYEELAHRAAAAVRRAGGAIVDATFRRADDAYAFTKGRAEPAWIVCEAPPEVLLERASWRAAGDSLSDAGPAVVARELGLYKGPFQPPGPPLARLDTTVPVPLLLDELAATLDARLGGPR